MLEQEKEMQKDHIKEMQHARNEGGIDTKVSLPPDLPYDLLPLLLQRLPSTKLRRHPVVLY